MLDRVVIMDENAAPTNTATSSSEMPQFPEGAYWEELLPQIAPAEKSINVFQVHAPTVPEEDHFHLHQKFNFNFTMERKAFTGKVKAK
eukprot:1673781-Ditylum_brightwellii.AAC.1